MTGGNKLDKSRNWEHFKRLRGIRDNLTIHPKQPRHSVKYTELADLINTFGMGVAGILIDLHIVCRNWIPPHIIRGYYAPEVQVVSVG